MKIQEAASLFINAGLSAFPCKNKIPHNGIKWSTFSNRVMTPDEIDQHFTKNTPQIAIICGEVSGMLEVLDFDLYNDQSGLSYKHFQKTVEELRPKLWDQLVIAKTKNNGYHLYYRCSKIEGNQKLAKKPVSIEGTKTSLKTIIETRSEGGYVIAAPTDGYEWKQGNYSCIQTISEDDRDFLIWCAKKFDAKKITPSKKNIKSKNNFDTRPGDDFNRRGCQVICDLLISHGWTETHKKPNHIFYRRPGKKNGYSANLNTIENIFFVYSSNANPFEFSGNCGGYDFFEIYTLLEHNHNYTKATRTLFEMGYGSASSETQAQNKSTPEQEKPEPTQKPDLSTGLTMTFQYKPTFTKPMVTLQDHQVLKRGGLMVVASSPGTGKSQLCEALISSHLTYQIDTKCDSFGLETRLESKDKVILYIDTERDENDVHKGLFRIKERANATIGNGLIQNDQFRNTIIKSFVQLESPLDKLKALKLLISGMGNRIGLIILDGVADVVTDINDLKECQELSHYLVAMANKFNFGVITTIHTNPATQKGRGHLGSELARKADSLFLLKKLNAGVRQLTTSFEFGKNRGDSDELSTAFVWSDEDGYFITASDADITPHKMTIPEKIKAIMKIGMGYQHNDLMKRYMVKYDKTDSSAKRAIKQATSNNTIEKRSDGFYYQI